MIDVLYILGTGSNFNDDELRYSLRTLDVHGKNIGQVIIAGVCPDFIDKKKVIFVPCEDIDTPTVNHWWKVRSAFIKTGVPRVMLMYDDIFLCKDIDCDKYPWYWRRDLPNRPQVGTYRQALNAAYNFLSAGGYPTKDYEEHMPCIYEKDSFMALDDKFRDAADDGGMIVRSTYANIFVHDAEKRDDVKVFVQTWPLEEWLLDKDCFSTSSTNFVSLAKRWLSTNYPNKSRWEK